MEKNKQNFRDFRLPTNNDWWLVWGLTPSYNLSRLLLNWIEEHHFAIVDLDVSEPGAKMRIIRIKIPPGEESALDSIPWPCHFYPEYAGLPAFGSSIIRHKMIQKTQHF